MSPKVSVIIPTYNRADLLPRAIDSVLNQTYRDLELIIVDDGSTDNTKEIVEKYQKKDERIKYLWEENSGGPARPYNLALKQCQGEFIAFLDSDDVWLPEKLERQINFIEKNRIMGCMCLVFEYNIDTHKLVGVCSPTLSDFLAKRELMNHIFPLNEDLKGIADREIYIRIEIAKMEKKIKSDDIRTLEEPLVIYTRHSRSLSFGKQSSPFFIEEYSSLLEKYSYLKNKNNLTSALKNILSECYAKLALHYLIIGDKKRAKEAVADSLKIKKSLLGLFLKYIDFLPSRVYSYARVIFREAIIENVVYRYNLIKYRKYYLNYKKDLDFWVRSM